ncbi:MAG TPA: efflux RND transporter permease subunit [Desulfosalsimonadaceae bacterium]|nr:efflux RND transporter permease subunit [Desulfosalsimonadaceae bacterium]
MKTAIAWFAENHVAANLLMFFILIAGILTGIGIKLEIFPDTQLDRISISVAYPGASPSEVEEGVVRRIEENVAGLEGIKRIDSVSREGSGSVTIEVMKGWDIKKLLDEVKSEVDRITTMPEEAEEPIVREVTRRMQVISVAIYGNVPETSIKHIAQTVKDELTNIEGITQADIAAIRENEIHLDISEKTLRKYNLTLGAVAEAVARSSLDLPAGSVDAEEGEVLIRTKGRRYYAREYRDVPIITRPDGTRITLGQIAELNEGFADVDLYSKFQGKPGAIINVYRVADQSALEVAQKVRDYVEKVQPTLPHGIQADYYQDMSTILKSRIELLTKNMVLGLMLVSLLLGVFLNVRLAFWVTLGIPISFAFGMMLLPYYDVSLNMISLFAFIMVLGIVVDDAIIVGENIFRQQEAGVGRLRAAVDGTLEVGRPVIFSVLTTMVAFWPLLMAGGTMGNLMRNIPLVVILVLLGSLVESLFILPAHLARSKAVQKTGARPKRMTLLLNWVIRKPYRRLVEFCVRWRYATLALGLCVLLLTFGVWAAGKIKFTFFPKVEGDVLECQITMPAGTPMQRTMEVVNHLTETAKKMLAEKDEMRPENAPPLVDHTASIIGAQFGRGGAGESGGHVAQIWVQLLEGEKRDISSAALSREWRDRAGKIPDADAITFKSEIHSAGNPVEVHLSLENHDQLLRAADELKNELEGFAGVFDISDSYMPGKMEMQLKLKPNAASLGLKLSDLARQVRHAFYGAEAMRFQRDKNEVKVLVRYPDEERKSLGNVEEMRIQAPDGSEVPFSEVAEVNMERGYASIERAQRLRVIKVIADVNENVTNANEVRQYLENDYLQTLKNRYAGLRFNIEGEGQEQKEVLGDVGKYFIIAIFCIYALLAVPFKSFSQPFIVMAAIPFGVVGAILGHLLMGFNISIISLFGIVGLSGVVVNDSLVLIHRVNDLRKDGFNAHDAVIEGGKLRFRAVILTSLTTFGGLTPMMLEKSIQARFLIPMAISLGFGVLFATLITLLLIPSGYMILEDLHNVKDRVKSLKTKQPLW